MGCAYRYVAAKGEEVPMKITDTIGLLLKGKGENRVLSIAPEPVSYTHLTLPTTERV